MTTRREQSSRSLAQALLAPGLRRKIALGVGGDAERAVVPGLVPPDRPAGDLEDAAPVVRAEIDHALHVGAVVAGVLDPRPLPEVRDQRRSRQREWRASSNDTPHPFTTRCLRLGLMSRAQPPRPEPCRKCRAWWEPRKGADVLSFTASSGAPIYRRHDDSDRPAERTAGLRSRDPARPCKSLTDKRL